jgi:hypothetical protein
MHDAIKNRIRILFNQKKTCFGNKEEGNKTFLSLETGHRLFLSIPIISF